MAVAGVKSTAVAPGAARARGGVARGQQQRGPARSAQARAEAAAAALPAAVPLWGRFAPRAEGGAAARDGGELGEALLRRRAAGGRAGALQQEAGAYGPCYQLRFYYCKMFARFCSVGISLREEWDYVVLAARIACSKCGLF